VYLRDESYVGRIERTEHGYLIRDKDHRDIYRIIQSSPKDLVNTESCRRTWFKWMKKELRLFRTDTKEVVGRIILFKRSYFLRMLSRCIRQPTFGVIFNPDVGTNAKILILGALFFHVC
jgi:hypothetical protein